jgi:hypothetical protein
VNDVEGRDHNLISGTILAFAWKDSGKKGEAGIRIAGVLAKIQTRRLHFSLLSRLYGVIPKTAI